MRRGRETGRRTGLKKCLDWENRAPVTSRQFKARLTQAFIPLGYSKSDRGVRADRGDVLSVIDFNPGFGKQWLIDVGFWIRQLGGDVPSLANHTHMYFRLERLVPALRKLILTAGCLDDEAQPQAIERLVEVLPNDVEPRLRQLTSVETLAKELSTLEKLGLVRVEAREFLMKINC